MLVSVRVQMRRCVKRSVGASMAVTAVALLARSHPTPTQSCPPMYFTIISRQYGQSCAQPSQIRSACQMPFDHERRENYSFVAAHRIVAADGEDDLQCASASSRVRIVLARE